MFARERVAYFSTRTGALSRPVRLFLSSPDTKGSRLTWQRCSEKPSLRLVYLRWKWGSLRQSAELSVPVSTWQGDPKLLSVPSTLSRRRDSCELYSHHRRPNQHRCRARFARRQDRCACLLGPPLSSILSFRLFEQGGQSHIRPYFPTLLSISSVTFLA